MSRNSYYSITYGGTELYPDHIYDWRVNGVNCVTEDYSVGSVNDIIFTFVTDIQPTKNASGEYERVTVEGSPATPVYFKVRDVTKTAGQNRYTITCTSEYDELDQPLPDSYATPVDNETVWQLFNRLQGFTVTTAPSSITNGDYEINPSWYSAGMTYRQAYSYLAQLMGIDISSFLRTSSTSSDMSKKFPSTINAQESNVLKFTPNNVKEIEIADYEVPALQGVWVESGNPDLPYYQYGSLDPTKSLILPYNPMAKDSTFVTDLYTKITSLQAYTPIKLTTWTDAHIPNSLGGDSQISTMAWWSTQFQWIKYTENNVDYYCPIFSWELSPSGLILEGTGNPIRQHDSGYTYEQAISAIEDKVNNITFMNIHPNGKETTDLDNCRNIGFYTYTSTVANNPISNTAGTLYVFKYSTTRKYQIAFANNNDNDDEVYVYIRKYNSSGYHAWRRLEVL